MSARVEVVTVPWEDADATRLRAAQQDELTERYAHLDEESDDEGADDGGVDDGDVPDLDPADVLAMLLLRVDDEPVGCAALKRSGEHGPGVAAIKRMYVAPPQRGRGLSRVLLQEIERTALAHGHRRLVLETGTEQQESIGLYRSSGYTDTDPFGLYLGSPSLICLAKDL